MKRKIRFVCIFPFEKKSGTLLSLEEIIFADISDTLQNCVPLLLNLLKDKFKI